MERAAQHTRVSCPTTSLLRAYQFAYTADADTQLPRLTSVIEYGRNDTPDAGTSIPVATFSYGAASSAGVLTYALSGSVAGPSAAQSGTLEDAIFDGNNREQSNTQRMLDINGDGMPDFVYNAGGHEQVAINTPSVSGVTFVPSGTLGNGPFSDDGTTQATFYTDPFFQLDENNGDYYGIMREAIDINGDGRVDIVDASETAHYWTVYLNTPCTTCAPGSTEVAWQRRLIPINSVIDTLLSFGEDPDLSAAANRYLGTDSSKTLSNGYLPISETFSIRDAGDASATPFIDHRFVLWDLRDINGDGYPDFVFNDAYYTFTQVYNDVFGELFDEYTYLGDVKVLYNVAGIILDDSGDYEVFSADATELTSDNCGVEHFVVAEPNGLPGYVFIRDPYTTTPGVVGSVGSTYWVTNETFINFWKGIGVF
jgi:hypothetical protein